MLMDSAQLSVLVIDMQTRLLPAIADGDALVARMASFLEAMRVLEVPIVATEHCAGQLGPSSQALPLQSAEILHKRSFAATASRAVSHLAPGSQVIVVGCEAHVCVLQTVAGLIAAGRTVWLIDALVGSRDAHDCELAVARMQHMGAHRVSTEMVYFECLRSADHPKFRQMIARIRDRS